MTTISCVICAYNEAGRIEQTLEAVSNHPLLSEIIVVNDGSSDDTEKILQAWGGITLISYPHNKGKTYALGEGIAASKGNLIMLLDADLLGITATDIDALALPVISGIADASISLRKNSLWIYRVIGIDFVSGERVLPRALLVDAVRAMQQLPRWGGEVFINSYLLKNKMRIAVVRWPGVYNVRKFAKVGVWEGMKEEARMIYDAFHVLTLWDTCTQILALLWYKVPERYTVSLRPVSSTNDSTTFPSM